MNKFTTGLLTALTATMTMGISMNAFGFLGLGGTTWKEEVVLHDGSKIVVERWHKRGGRHEISSGPPVKKHTITFTPPGTGKTLTWRDEYSDDVGSANFSLLALHILNGTPYLVAESYGCIAYNKWGRPNPPYIIFKHDGNGWPRIPLSELPAEFKTINLVIGPSNEEKTLEKLGKVSVVEMEKMNRDYRQPHHRAIVREGLAADKYGCEELILYRGHWIQPNSAAGRFVVDGIIERKSK